MFEMLTEDLMLVEEDGFYLPEVGDWADQKHSRFGYYASLFSVSMKKKWDCRVFMDLFAGAGKARIKQTGRIIPGSPLLTLSLETPFDRYVFCELDDQCMTALRSRINKYFPSSATRLIDGDCNQQVQKIISAVPQFSKTHKGLTLCFVDPFKASALKFSTLRAIAAALYVDFIVLIPSFMDIKRNEHIYTQDSCIILDEFLGTRNWRSTWANGKTHFQDFAVFIADQFGQQMKALGYHYDPEALVTVRIGEDRSLYLYHLGFFSRDELGVKFWKETMSRTSIQMNLL